MYTVILYSKIDNSIISISPAFWDIYQAFKWADRRKARNNYYEITED